MTLHFYRLSKQALALLRKRRRDVPGIPDIVREHKEFEKGDALLEEIKAFLKCIEQ